MERFAEWIVYKDIFIDGEYDAAIDAVIASPAGSNPLVLDLGANVGYFSLRFVDRWMSRKGEAESFRIVGVEGSPGIYAVLKHRMSQGRLEGRCKFHHGLVGQRTGEALISSRAFHVRNSIMEDAPRNATRVAFLPVDGLIDPGERVALLKCDIEGAEEQFLANHAELLRRVDAAVMELHYQACDVNHCLEMLRDAGMTEQQTLRDQPPSFKVVIARRPAKDRSPDDRPA